MAAGSLFADTFILNDGTVINGKIVQNNKNSVIIEDEKGNLRSIPNSMFKKSSQSDNNKNNTNTNTVNPVIQAQRIIDSNEISEKGGVEKLQNASTQISPDWRYYFYARNAKLGSFGFLIDLFYQR